MYINKIFQVRTVKKMFAGYISLEILALFTRSIFAEYAACNVLQTECTNASNGAFQTVAGFWKVLWTKKCIQRKWIQLFVLIMVKPILAWVYCDRINK